MACVGIVVPIRWDDTSQRTIARHLQLPDTRLTKVEHATWSQQASALARRLQTETPPYFVGNLLQRVGNSGVCFPTTYIIHTDT